MNNPNCEDDPNSASNIFEVSISHGILYPSFKVPIKICSPGNEPPTQFSIAPRDVNAKATYEEQYPVPFELAPSAFLDLRDKLILNMDETAGIDRSPKELAGGFMSTISFEVLHATYQYMIATSVSKLQHRYEERKITHAQNEFVLKARGLYAMHWLVTHTLCLDDESEKIFWARHPASKDSKYHPNLVPRKVTSQIRDEVRKLILKRTECLLKELEKLLKLPNRESTWGPCFCVISILCICSEILQIATDTNVIYEMHQKEPVKPISRKDCIEYCQRLDRLPISETIINFHARQRSHQLKEDKQIQNGFNPPRDGPEGLTQSDKDLALDIRRIWEEHSEIIFGT